MSTKFLKLFFPHFFMIFNLLKQVFCKHDYDYWDTHLENVNNDGSLTFAKNFQNT